MVVISWDLNWCCALERCQVVFWLLEGGISLLRSKGKKTPKMLSFVLRKPSGIQRANLWKYPRDKYCALLVGKWKYMKDCKVCICNCLDCAHLANSQLTPSQSQEQIPQLFRKKWITHVPPKCLSLYRGSLNKKFSASCDNGSTISIINCVI